MKKLLFILTLFLIIGSCKKVEQDELSVKVTIPNAFRPDSPVPCIDGDIDCNMVFKVVVDQFQTLNGEIRIYNSHQKLVFKTTEVREGWNGRELNKGNICPQGYYDYLVKITESPSGKSKVFEGKVLLLR